MDVEALLKQYKLHAPALGYSPKTVAHVCQSVSAFANFIQAFRM